MDCLNTWPTEAVPGFARELSGTFVATLEGMQCLLTLSVTRERLTGSFTLDEMVFDIKGFFSSIVVAAYGILLEPASCMPVALLRITPGWQGVNLELDMPDFDAGVMANKPGVLHFRRQDMR